MIEIMNGVIMVCMVLLIYVNARRITVLEKKLCKIKE